MKQYTEQDIQKKVEEYNAIVKPQYKIEDDWIYWLITEAWDNQNLVKPFYKIPDNETLSGRVEVFRAA